MPCDLGTFWKDTKTCTKCPDTFTTMDRASVSEDACTVKIVNPLASFQKNAGRYLFKSNAAGQNLEQFDHLTPAQCAQVCLNDKGCKSFDAGNPSRFQSGDCFLSYDNKNTIKPGDFRAVPQLDYFEKRTISENSALCVRASLLRPVLARVSPPIASTPSPFLFRPFYPPILHEEAWLLHPGK